MSITKQAPRCVVLSGPVTAVNDLAASEAITPVDTWVMKQLAILAHYGDAVAAKMHNYITQVVHPTVLRNRAAQRR